MSGKREDLKRSVMSTFEKQLDELLAALPAEGELNLTQIEDRVLSLRAQMSQAVTQALVDREAQAHVPELICPECGKATHNKGVKGKQVVTRTGDTQVKRNYVYCASCGKGFFPPR